MLSSLTGGGSISGGTSSAENGDFTGGGQGGRVTFNNHQGSSGSNKTMYALLAAIVLVVALWLRK